MSPPGPYRRIAAFPASEALQEGLGATVGGGREQQTATQAPILPHPPHEALHRGQHRLAVREVVGVVHLDVRDDRAGRVVVEEVVAELVRLHQERRSPTGAHAGAPGRDEGADLDGGVHAGRLQQVPQQGGGGRLAVRAGDGQPDAALGRHQLTQQRLPGDDGKADLLGGEELRQVGNGAQGGRDGHPLHAGQVRGVVAADDADPRRVEGRRVRGGRVRVAAVDQRPGVMEQERHAGRARAGDADDVDPLSGAHQGAAVTSSSASSSAASAAAARFPSRSWGKTWCSTRAGCPRRATPT